MQQLRRVKPVFKTFVPNQVGRRHSSQTQCDPLRILYCGSDEFSGVSLRALREEQSKHPDVISSLDVVCRPGKRVGRGLKTIREVPLKRVAEELNLPIHEVDTFTGWNPPRPRHQPINLIIAVSFGLFVPPRILHGAKYGGLNVHPSLLPEFRGAAPLHHTLLAGLRKTGVTLQTLDPERFDHGRIVAQTPSPGIDIPNPDTCTVQQLNDLLAPLAAQLLVRGIRERLFVPDSKKNDLGKGSDVGEHIKAPKIRPEDRHIDWKSWTAKDIIRREGVLGPLWNMAVFSTRGEAENHKRIIMEGIREVPSTKMPAAEPGLPFRHVDGSVRRMLVWTCDGKLLEIPRIKIEGKPMTDASKVIENATFHKCM